MQHIKVAANKLKGCKLKRLNSIEPILEQIKNEMFLSIKEEAMILVAILDRQCSNRSSDLDDLSGYFECSALDIMEFVPAIQSLSSKGYIKADNINERDVTKMDFQVCPDVFCSIVTGEKINPVPSTSFSSYDQFDFCNSIHQLIEERTRHQIDTRKLFVQSELLEQEHADLELVKGIKCCMENVCERVLFYEMCKDFSNSYEGSYSNLNSTLQDIYDKLSDGALVKKQLMDNEHPLIKAELIELRERDELALAEEGIKLLLGDKASVFIKSYTCSDKYEFIEKIRELVDDLCGEPDACTLAKLYSDVVKIEDRNKHISCIENIKKLLDSRFDRLLYYMVCKEMLDSDTYSIRQLRYICSRHTQLNVKRELKEEHHALQQRGLVEMSGGGILEGSTLQLTDKGKELFLEEDMELFSETVSDKSLIRCEKIMEKKLFFEPALERQLFTLQNSLEEQKYTSLCDRLKENNLPTGVAVLLYGLPGTGKTESVMQIARATGRCIMHVDISATKTCWFGESEKLIKRVFDDYRNLCKKSKLKPILLFNEADAVFSKRKDSNSSSVAQTENAIQNIILEEMENLDGILVATTNLADNLDKAFERRFLFKIRFDKPTVESKVSIWRNKMPNLTDVEAMRLASGYDFSGGEIDNIVRKATMEEVIHGTVPTINRLVTLCNEEKIGKSVKKIGF